MSTISASTNGSSRGRAIDQRDAHAERGEHAGVLAADDAGADDGERARQLVEAAGCRRW